MPFFSVIMPAYNSSQHISAAVESVLLQNEKDFELIIIDDGSSDDTYEIACGLANNDSRISVKKLKHIGVSNARNHGIDMAKGEYILFIDADDYWQYDLLEKCRKNCLNDDLTLFGIREDYYKGNKLIRSVNSSQSSCEKVQHLHFQIDMLSEYNFASPCNKVYVRGIIQKYNVRFSVDCVYLEDLKFNMDYLYHTDSICVLNEDLYFYRLNAEGGQIKKRCFTTPLLNADLIYSSFESYSNKKLKNACYKNSLLNGILTNAYLAEVMSLIDNGQYDSLNLLNNNDNFRSLLKYSPRKRDLLLRLCIVFNFKHLEIRIIKRGFSNV